MGDTTTVTLTASELPAGISGYDANFTLDNPEVASIVNAEVADGFAITRTDINEDNSSVFVRAADLNSDIEPGAQNVPLVTLTIQGDQAGETGILVENPNFDDDANQGAPIDFVVNTGTITVGDGAQPSEPANFDVSNLDAPSSVTAGETVTVSADIENTGETEGTQSVEFRIDLDQDGTPETIGVNESLTLDAGSSDTVTFEVPTAGVPAGTYTHGVFTANDSATAQITVEEDDDTPPAEPANFDVSNLDAPANVTVGDVVTVNATITNTGETEGTQTVEFRIDLNGDGTPEAIGVNESLTLDADANQTVSFEVPTDGVPAGTYTHGVYTEDDSMTAQITVEEGDVTPPEPTANVTFENQTSDGTTVTVDSVTMSEGGFVAIHDSSLLEGDALGSVVGVSEYLSAGTHEDVEVTLFDVAGANFSENMTLEENQTLIAMPHLDTNDNQMYDFVASDGQADGPYTADGSAVVDDAYITVESDMEPQPPETTYYQVDFIGGEPYEQIGGEYPLYAEEDRLLRFAHGNTDEGITDRDSAWADESLRNAVDYGHIVEHDNGTASVSFTVAENASDVTLSLAVYEKPGSEFDPNETQTLLDASTDTYAPGNHTVTVDLPENDSDDEVTQMTAGAVPVAPSA